MSAEEYGKIDVFSQVPEGFHCLFNFYTDKRKAPEVAINLYTVSRAPLNGWNGGTERDAP